MAIKETKMTRLARYLMGIDEAKMINTKTFDGEHWYMAADICCLMGITNHSQVVRDYLDYDESRKETIYIGGYGKKKVLLVNDSGMLKIIMRGRTEFAFEAQERLRATPEYLKTTPWPYELFLDKAA